jgi:AcrR family transcriptional regulator
MASATAGSDTTHDQRRRDEILETASQVFGTQGLRTSLQEIADACGIRPGSLYHHFESKEAIVVELIDRYRVDLDSLAESTRKRLKGSDVDPAEAIRTLAVAIARTAERHAAAVQSTFYDFPGSEGTDEAASVRACMQLALERGQQSGFIRPKLDVAIVSDRMCQTMLHVGLGLFHGFAADQVANTLLGVLLHGLATESPTNGRLDASAAFRAVQKIVNAWPEATVPDKTDRAAYLSYVARTEFGRRGYEVTTVRDIAAAAGMGTGSVYRAIGSKEELLTSIMTHFTEHVIAGWTAALSSDSTVVEKLDAVCWLQVNAMERFHDEYKIQLAWLRQVPPDIPSADWSFPSLLRTLRKELRAGLRAGDIRIESPSAELTARCVVEVTWVPESIVTAIGTKAALGHARDSVLRGVATRR